mmetsp:Transcript_24067/g.56778  ORF Transcript_24067/g.56778 Transcript_24067/m.56778 type:complete len:221 (-) Transcript_24067:909-1571(-)
MGQTLEDLVLRREVPDLLLAERLLLVHRHQDVPQVEDLHHRGLVGKVDVLVLRQRPGLLPRGLEVLVVEEERGLLPLRPADQRLRPRFQALHARRVEDGDGQMPVHVRVLRLQVVLGLVGDLPVSDRLLALHVAVGQRRVPDDGADGLLVPAVPVVVVPAFAEQSDSFPAVAPGRVEELLLGRHDLVPEGPALLGGEDRPLVVVDGLARQQPPSEVGRAP